MERVGCMHYCIMNFDLSVSHKNQNFQKLRGHNHFRWSHGFKTVRQSFSSPAFIQSTIEKLYKTNSVTHPLYWKWKLWRKRILTIVSQLNLSEDFPHRKSGFWLLWLLYLCRIFCFLTLQKYDNPRVHSSRDIWGVMCSSSLAVVESFSPSKGRRREPRAVGSALQSELCQMPLKRASQILILWKVTGDLN